MTPALEDLRLRHAALVVPQAAVPVLPPTLDALMAQASERVSAATDAKTARKRLAHGDVKTDVERDALKDMIERYDSLVLWNTVANVALVHEQVCRRCNRATRWLVGWMREQEHRHGPAARRLVRGRSPMPLPERVEVQAQPAVDECPCCLTQRLGALK